MLIITDELARRLEAAEALDGIDCAEACSRLDPECGVNVKAVGGGFCLFCGPASPLSHALAMGLYGAVSREDVLEVEEFFHSRGAPVVIDISAHADPSLRELLSGRGYRVAEINNVLVRQIAAEEELPDAGIPMREASQEDADTYIRALVRGFFTRDDIGEDEARIGRLLFDMAKATPLLAEVNGVTAGACSISYRNRTSSFFGDAVLSAYRRQGIHRAMIVDRLRRAAAAECDVATAGTQPGSESQRNYQRLGFEVAYSKIVMVRD